MIKACLGQWQCHAGSTELALKEGSSRRVGTKAAAEPEQAPPGIPDAIAGAFEDESFRQPHDFVEHASFGERGKVRRKYRLLVLSLRMAKPRQHGLAVEHHCGIGRKDQVRQTGNGVDRLHHGACAEERLMQLRPLALRIGLQIAVAIGPRLRIHPRINAVSDGKMARQAHQEMRPRALLRERRVNAHSSGSVPSAGAARNRIVAAPLFAANIMSGNTSFKFIYSTDANSFTSATCPIDPSCPSSRA